MNNKAPFILGVVNYYMSNKTPFILGVVNYYMSNKTSAHPEPVEGSVLLAL